jgi:hypothetical protein
VLIFAFLGNEQRNYFGNKAPSRLNVIWKLYLGEGETIISRKAGIKAASGEIVWEYKFDDVVKGTETILVK